jgi:hypothetical protein
MRESRAMARISPTRRRMMVMVVSPYDVLCVLKRTEVRIVSVTRDARGMQRGAFMGSRPV